MSELGGGELELTFEKLSPLLRCRRSAEVVMVMVTSLGQVFVFLLLQIIGNTWHGHTRHTCGARLCYNSGGGGRLSGQLYRKTRGSRGPRVFERWRAGHDKTYLIEDSGGQPQPQHLQVLVLQTIWSQ